MMVFYWGDICTSSNNGGWFSGESTMWLDNWDFQPCPLTSMEGRIAGGKSITSGQWCNQACQESIGSQRIGHNWSDLARTHAHTHTYIMKPPYKPNRGDSESFQDGEPELFQGSPCQAQLYKDRISLVWDLTLCIFSSGYWFPAFVCANSLQLCPTLCDPMDSSLPGFSVRGILQATILEWVAMTSSRGLPDPGIKPTSLVSPALESRFFTTSTTWEALPLISL